MFAFGRVLVEVEGAIIIRWEVFIIAPIITVIGLAMVLIMLSVPWVKGWRLLKVLIVAVVPRRFDYISATGRRFDWF